MLSLSHIEYLKYTCIRSEMEPLQASSSDSTPLISSRNATEAAALLTAQQMSYDQALFRIASNCISGKSIVTSVNLKGTGIVREHLLQIVDSIPAILRNDSNTSKLSRALWHAIRPFDSTFQTKYSRGELEEALFSIAIQKCTQPQAVALFGVSSRTLRRELHNVKEGLQLATRKITPLRDLCSSDELSVKEQIRKVVHAKYQRRQSASFLLSDEADLIASHASHLAWSGKGSSNLKLQNTVNTIVKAIGEEESRRAIATGDPSLAKAAQKKLNCVITRKFVMDILVNSSYSRSRNGAFRRTPDANWKRMVQFDQTREDTFVRKVMDHVRKHIATGTFTKEQWLDPINHSNADEVGQPTKPKHSRTFRYLDKGNKGCFEGCQTESSKSLFQISIYITTGPGGGGEFPLPPVIIHQSQNLHQISAALTHGLSDDMMVGSSPSGYNTQDIFLKTMQALHVAKNTGPGNPHFHWCDAHFSHMGWEGAQYALDNSIYVIYLRSNASIVDQPNDNGPNAKWKYHVKMAYYSYLEKWPSLGMTQSGMNEIIATAWASYQADPKMKSCILRAWEKTHLYPFPGIL